MHSQSLNEFRDTYLIKYQSRIRTQYSTYSKLNREKLALLALERQFMVYQKNAENNSWNRSMEYRKVMDELWHAIFTNHILDDTIWEEHERIRPESIDCHDKSRQTNAFSYASIFAGNMSGYIDMVLDDLGNEECFAIMNLDMIFTIMEEKENEKIHALLNQEITYQIKDAEVVEKIQDTEAVQMRIQQYSNILCS